MTTEQQYSLCETLAPNTITFTRNAAEKVMTISKDGVWVNPNVPVDEASAAVIEALDQHIKALVKRETAQRDELLEANADLLKQLSSYQVDWESQEDLLEQLYWSFAEDRENEKISFKDKMKFFAGKVNQYANELIAALRTKSQPLSDTEIQRLYMEASLVDSGFVNPFARLIEAAHGIGVEE